MRSLRPINWLNAARRDFEDFPPAARSKAADALSEIAEGKAPEIAKPMTGLGSGVWELAIRATGDAYRVVYALHPPAWRSDMGHPRISKESQTRDNNAEARDRRSADEAQAADGAALTPTDDDMKPIYGSGNVYRDLGIPNPEARQLKAILAAQVHKVLDDEGITTRKAQELTGIDQADFARVRKCNLGRFSVERLITMLEGLGQEVEVSVEVHPRRRSTAALSQPHP